MYPSLFAKFLLDSDTLRVYEGRKLVFSSKKNGMSPLLEYVDSFAHYHPQVVIFDKIMGNAAALLSVKANCLEVYSPLGSQLAIETLEKHGIKHRIIEVVPHIQKPDGSGMCPMEKLSLDKDPEEFHEALKKIIK